MVDTWAVGDAYDAYIGRWSRLVAVEFLGWLGAPAGQRWLDVGCGTGALTAAILATAEPAHVRGVDPSEGFLARARHQLADAEFALGDARALPVPDHDVDVVVSGLALNFVPEPAGAVREFVRAVRPGGIVAAYVWDYASGMQMLCHFWAAAVALDPLAADEARRFPLCRPAPLAELWSAAGLGRVRVEPITIPTVFADFADFWEPFLGGQGPAPGYVAALSDSRREALRALLEDRLPRAADGTIPLTAQAWGVRGTNAAASR